MKIYFVRHGKTEWNKLKKMQGSADIPLNEEGIEQAYKTKELISNIEFDCAICSPLTRTKQTLNIILDDKKIPVIYDERIVERNYGEFEGTTKNVDFDYNEFWNYTKNVKYKKAENIRDFFERIYSFLDDLKTKEYEKVLIVAQRNTYRLERKRDKKFESVIE
jgi:broad specificity phosphatase PhoE